MDVREKSSNEKRLIDANKLIDFIDVGYLRHSGKLCYSEIDVANLLLHAPTINAVEVVRCRECKHYDTADFDGNILCGCTLHSAMLDITPDSFCSYGERRGGQA